MNRLLDAGRTLPPLILLLAGGYMLIEAAGMTEFGAIFPRLAGGGFVVGALVLLARVAAGKPDAVPTPDKAGRALLLLAVLMAWAFLLTAIGFVPACLIGAAATSVLAQSRLPPARTLAIRAAGLMTITFTVAALFSLVLNVPLP